LEWRVAEPDHPDDLATTTTREKGSCAGRFCREREREEKKRRERVERCEITGGRRDYFTWKWQRAPGPGAV
jgi:hypothetical protein